MFPRHALSYLRKWAKKEDRKPLIIRGARQVGKTSLVKMFSKNFDQYIYLDLEIKKNQDLFNNNLDVNNLYQSILLSGNYSSKKKTLLFLDEIQSSFQAIGVLRYFYEKLPSLFVIAAGSLLEAVIDKNKNPFPVGRVEYLFLYPLNFQEFLIAMGAKQAISLLNTIPIPDYANSKLFEYFHEYTLIGGMPEIIKNYIKNKDITELNIIYQSLLHAYLNDVSKYAQNSTIEKIIRHCIETIPFTSGQRIKFAHFGNSDYRSREVGEALKILERALLLNFIYPSTSIELPIIPNFKKHPKILFFDSGLINYLVGLQKYFFTTDNLHGFYNGMIAEHIVIQELKHIKKNRLQKLCFWVRESKSSNAEVDFLLQHQNFIIPIEVKAGALGRLRSLHLFMQESKSLLAVRFSKSKISICNLKTKEGRKYILLNLPYFLAAKVHEYIDYVLANKFT